jgi:predicted membrane metal-binding protein
LTWYFISNIKKLQLNLFFLFLLKKKSFNISLFFFFLYDAECQKVKAKVCLAKSFGRVKENKKWRSIDLIKSKKWILNFFFTRTQKKKKKKKRKRKLKLFADAQKKRGKLSLLSLRQATLVKRTSTFTH